MLLKFKYIYKFNLVWKEYEYLKYKIIEALNELQSSGSDSALRLSYYIEKN